MTIVHAKQGDLSRKQLVRDGDGRRLAPVDSHLARSLAKYPSPAPQPSRRQHHASGDGLGWLVGWLCRVGMDWLGDHLINQSR